ncbi:MAG: hypothetical protein JWP92_3542, partial [Caulobacter sp.]|nr:hypothetical protein [Caulobacter sp.]
MWKRRMSNWLARGLMLLGVALLV